MLFREVRRVSAREDGGELSRRPPAQLAKLHDHLAQVGGRRLAAKARDSRAKNIRDGLEEGCRIKRPLLSSPAGLREPPCLPSRPPRLSRKPPRLSRKPPCLSSEPPCLFHSSRELDPGRTDRLCPGSVPKHVMSTPPPRRGSRCLGPTAASTAKRTEPPTSSPTKRAALLDRLGRECPPLKAPSHPSA